MDVKKALMTKEHVTNDGNVSSSFNKLNNVKFASISWMWDVQIHFKSKYSF